MHINVVYISRINLRWILIVRGYKKVWNSIMLTMIGALLVLNLSSTALAQQPLDYTTDENVNINVYENVSPCVVTVLADVSEGASSGTGIIIEPSGIILTSSHVVGKSKQINVAMASGQRYSGHLLAITGKNDDLALVKITPSFNLPAAKLGDSTKIRVGQKVLAIGNPFGFERTLTTGIISRIDYGRHRIQTDAAINPGCSGGPLLNSKGEVIGINQSIYNPDNNKSNIGISFAVPINAAKRFINDVAEGLKSNDKHESAALFSNNYKNVSQQVY